MNAKTIPIVAAAVDVDAQRQRKREAPKGRRVDPVALQQLQGLLEHANIEWA